MRRLRQPNLGRVYLRNRKSLQGRRTPRRSERTGSGGRAFGASMSAGRKEETARLVVASVALAGLIALSGCADSLAGMSLPAMPKLNDLNPWAEKEVPLPGKRIAIIQQENLSTNLSTGDRPVTLPAPRSNES